jgi:hypothetical protein
MNMQNENTHNNGALSETVVAALISASEELSTRETWVASRRSGASAMVPRVMSVIMSSQKMLRRNNPVRIYVRQNVLKILAYLPSDLRLGALIDMAGRNPDALDDIFTGEVSEDYEIYKFNVISSLGVFARHGLVEEVFTQSRINEVGQSVRDSHRKAAMKSRGK